MRRGGWTLGRYGTWWIPVGKTARDTPRCISHFSPPVLSFLQVHAEGAHQQALRIEVDRVGIEDRGVRVARVDTLLNLGFLDSRVGSEV